MAQESERMKEFSKRILEHLRLLGPARRIWSLLTRTITTCYQARLKSPYWREQHFNTLSSTYAVSDHPNENYVVKTSDKIIGKLLFCRGDFDLRKFERALKIIDVERDARKPRKVFDVGANIGPICIPAVRRGYVKHAIAFEPDPENFRLLRINAILNGVENLIEFHQVALGAEKGQAQLALNTINHGDHRILPANVTASVNSITVPVHCLDDYISKDDDFLSILWIDVQGYETQVLRGAQSALAKACPLVLEFTPSDLKQNGSFDLFIELLTQGTYKKFFDLEQESPTINVVNMENLDTLAKTLASRDTFTDILVI